MLKGKFRIFASIILVFGLSFGELRACMCAEETIETANYERYDEVFLGKLLNIRYFEVTALDGENQIRLGGAEYTFEVTKKWKGKASKIIKVRELLNSCSVGYHMVQGEWLVSAYQKKWLGNK